MKTTKFEELTISDKLLHGIRDMGFEEATPIQTKAIPFILEGRDVTGQAQTGTGKTAAFGIPILEKINPKDKSVQCMVICPTRELVIQVAEEIRKMAKYLHDTKVLPIYGGQPIQRQINALKKSPQIIIGTPGRIQDHMRRRTLKVGNLQMVVLDEADEMLNMGFKDDIETILKDTPEKRQTILFSATIPKAILEIAKEYQKNPETVRVVHKKLTVPSIEQYYFEVKRNNKLEILSRLIDIYNPKLALVFCNTKMKVDEVSDQLQSRGYFSDKLHGDMKQRQRDRVMNLFRNGDIEILVATDVAARGIDVDDVEIVFNFDVPQDEEYYVHRIGRTGRAGREGKAFTFVSGKEVYKLRNIQKYTKTKIKRERTPSVSDVEEAKTSTILNQIKNIIENESLRKEINIVEKIVEDDFNTIDVAASLLKIVMGQHKQEEKEEELDFGDTGAEPGMVRLFINIGKNQKVRPKDVLGAIAGESGLPGDLVGAIDIYDKFTFVEVPKIHANKVLNAMKDNRIKGKTINIEPANKK
ncbi:DEAD/DEAH box helicase [Abyssisolibacter fermentans]|uniref:DEAD/DEAH box helicase n=1 Tax=Abyssisolibacter fermentans TaxID=1766203 RepID=UPI00082FC35C|nr:DEAD/DEAH box helicase [Abyssisolibacter fermentans]